VKPLLLGVCAKAAFSYEKSKDLSWRPKKKPDDGIIETDDEEFLFPYDVRLEKPHASISSVIGELLVT